MVHISIMQIDISTENSTLHNDNQEQSWANKDKLHQCWISYTQRKFLNVCVSDKFFCL
jgi:hypothetical protein